MLSLLPMILVILRRGAFVLLLISIVSISIHAQEFRAIELDMEADILEKKGDKELANEKRALSREIRRRNFSREKKTIVEVGDPKPKLPHPFVYGNKPWLGGFWELGFRGNVPRADFHSGMDWSLDNGRVAFQAGSPYLPRNVIPYQNESALPFIQESGRLRPKEGMLPTLQLSYVAENKKWGFEYSNLPMHGSYDHYAYGFNGQVAKYNTRFQMYDHRLMVKIHEELDQERWFSWDFGMRVGGWQTDSSFVSPTLNQAGDLKETARFVAPSAGFRLYQSAIKNSRIEFGSDVFYTTLGSLQYERRFTRDGLIDLSGAYIPGNQTYKIESAKPLDMKISGIDINLVYSFVLMDFHRFSFGAKTTGYTWAANESTKIPYFSALSSEALGLAIMNWYTTSAYYQADGDGKRASRYFSVTNFFIGYNYVF